MEDWQPVVVDETHLAQLVGNLLVSKLFAALYVVGELAETAKVLFVLLAEIFQILQILLGVGEQLLVEGHIDVHADLSLVCIPNQNALIIEFIVEIAVLLLLILQVLHGLLFN